MSSATTPPPPPALSVPAKSDTSVPTAPASPFESPSHPSATRSGRHSGEVAVCADQSYRLLAAAEHELAETRFTTVVTALSEGIIVMEADGTITSMNPAARAFFGDRDSEGTNGLHVLARHRLVDDQAATLPKGRDPLSVTVATGVAAKDRIIGVDDDKGGRRWLSVSCETLERRPDGVPASIMCSLTDITDHVAPAKNA